ncbi:SDR family NAD(P)-dependent oxidoreductase [Muricoccus pecuniae]|uniref:3-oxoacyl-[acyl-carrier protein] reductase n=1 Tax=Muricoccus pecuniae TaxID=693023 RepID=A0A840YMM7_9PROT|nr:SDR family NAD(P)-dependent oxidoreductase [Roseomonas pecuniae]MBB5696313.1 3-oxoacyl-[acyl-carrier protein] reductase [Roseomonas pecuniae]
MRIDFTGRTVLVAGAARGIGRGMVEGFAAAGASVFAGDRLEAELAGLPAATRVVDLTDRGSVCDWVASAGGAPDVLVYVAGGVLGQAAKPVEEVDEADFRAIVDINLTGAFLTAQAVVPGMKTKGQGRIILIVSGAGLRTSLTGIQAYAAGKAGEIGLTRQLAQELGPFGITVNGIAPGFQRTSPDYERQWQDYSPERQAALIQGTAMRRAGTPEDIAHAAMFFASDYASLITGQILSVTGSP